MIFAHFTAIIGTSMSKRKKSPAVLIRPKLLAWFITTISVVGLLLPLAPSLTQELHLTDKLLHVVMFGVLTIAWLIAYRRHRTLLLAELFVYAGWTELLQYTLVPGRTADVLDVLANGLGICLGWWIVKREEK